MEFSLRMWKESDAQSIARYANNPNIEANLRDGFPIPYTEKDARHYLAACIAASPSRECSRAIVVDGQAVGSIGVFFKDNIYHRSGEIGYWLGEPFWGKGITSEAVDRLCREVFLVYDNIVRIYAEPFAYNTGSRRVLEKAGFALEGILRQNVCKHGKIYDSCIYARLRDSE